MPGDRVQEIIRGGNQRGGRMLSVIDLIKAGTLTVPQTAWLLERIEAGSGWLVGARPGGAGKTTIMCALLAMLPERTRIRVAAADPDWRGSASGDCIVAYEIGQGWYRGYVWGDDLCDMCALGESGCRVVTNLHADNLAEAHDQIVRQNGVSERGMAAFGMFLALEVDGGWGHRPRRTVRQIDYWDSDRWVAWREGSVAGRQGLMAQEIEAMRRKNVIEITAVRGRWLNWLAENPRS